MMSDLVHQNAADALANLAGDPAARDEIVVAGGIPPLVQLLEVVGRNTKQFAATALARLSKDHEATQLAIAKAGAIASLVALLAGNEGGEAQEAAAGAILSLADHEGNRQTITDSGGIGYLVMLLGSTNSKARESKRRKAWSSLDHLSPPLSTSHLPSLFSLWPPFSISLTCFTSLTSSLHTLHIFQCTSSSTHIPIPHAFGPLLALPLTGARARRGSAGAPLV